MSILNNTATTLRASLVLIASDFSEGVSFKDSKLAVKEAGKVVSQSLSGYEVECFTPEFTFYAKVQAASDEAVKQRSCDKFSKSIDATIATIDAWLALEVPEADESTMVLLETTETDEGPALSRNDEIIIEVKELLQVATQSFIKVGVLLTEARADAENQKEFLDWTEANFGIKKAQAFKLMKIAKEFEGDDRFTGCSMRVLDMLTGATEAVKVEAGKLAEAGELGSKAAKGLTTEVITPDFSEEVEAKIDLPFDLGATLTVEESTKPTIAPNVVHSLDAGMQNSAAFVALQAQLSKLLEQNDELTRKLEEATKPKRVQSLPMLPHFNSKSFTTRLGLEVDASVKDVRGAYRAIVKHYNAEANPEAFKLLTEAKEALTA